MFQKCLLEKTEMCNLDKIHLLCYLLFAVYCFVSFQWINRWFCDCTTNIFRNNFHVASYNLNIHLKTMHAYGISHQVLRLTDVFEYMTDIVSSLFEINKLSVNLDTKSFSTLYVANSTASSTYPLCFLPLWGKNKILGIQAASSVTLWKRFRRLLLIDFPTDTSCPPSEAIFPFLIPTEHSHDQRCPWRKVRIPAVTLAQPRLEIRVFVWEKDEGGERQRKSSWSFGPQRSYWNNTAELRLLLGVLYPVVSAFSSGLVVVY